MPDAAKDAWIDPARQRVGWSPAMRPLETAAPLLPTMPRPAPAMTDAAAREATLARSRARAKAAAGRHSRFVRGLKIVLPIAGVLIAAVVIGRFLLTTFIPGLNMPAVLFTKNGLTMVEPRLTGRSRDRAYDFSAARAMQDFVSPKVFQMEQLAGRVEMKDNGWAKIESRTGTYDNNRDNLKLVGNVTVTTSTGYVLKGDNADIDLTKGNMATDKPVRIQGPTGWLEAGAAQVTDNGALIRFSQGVHMTINPAVVPPLAGTQQQTGSGTTP